MKLEFWHEDMIRFMTDASEYGDYYRQLTEKMLPWLSADMHICDAGSGLGYLSLAWPPMYGRSPLWKSIPMRLLFCQITAKDTRSPM